ncbi:MAG: SpoIIE family protein phosphatase [Bacteroidetes bacterium]|nr:SpoIIE family protein phosphatase [Bacteroidota bacterium]
MRLIFSIFAAMFPSSNKHARTLTLFILALFHFCNPAFSQSVKSRARSDNHPQKKGTTVFTGEKGLYPIYNYSTKTYSALPQNWAIVQDKRGVMYFGNNDGVLEYDGVSWRTIKVSNETNIRSLAIDDKGKIYVGAEGEFGYLKPDSSGNMRYISMLPLLEKKDRGVSHVWSTQITKQGIFFQSDNKIFRWDGKKMKVWNAEKSFHRIFKVYDHLFVRQREIGLMEIVGDDIVALKGGEEFSEEGIYAMIPFLKNPKDHSSQDVLLCTRKKGLYIMKQVPKGNLLKGESSFLLEHFRTQIDSFLLKNISYHLLKTDAGYSIATITKGSVIVDSEGTLVNFLNKDVGLQDETIYSQYIDASGNMWLALSNGIARVAINSPITYFSGKNGPGGTVQSIVRHNNKIYVSTEQGVCMLHTGTVTNESNPTTASFEKIPSINEQCWDLLSFKSGNYSSLLVASNGYIYSINSENNVSALFPYGPWTMYRSKFDSSRIYLGNDNGFASIYWDGKKWNDEGSIPEIKESIRSIREDKSGVVWMGYNGVIRLVFNNSSKGIRKNSDSKSYSYAKYDTASGLPSGIVGLENFSDKILFLTEKGFYKFSTNDFSPDTSFGNRLADGSHKIHRISKDDQSENIWLETYLPKKNKFEFGFLEKEKNETYSWNTTDFLPYSNEIINAIYNDDNGITWFGGAAGLFRHDATVNGSHNQTSSIIRRVTTANDDTLFNGTFFDSSEVSSLIQNPSLQSVISYSNNSVLFEFSTLDFINEEAEQYQYYLEGFDNGKNSWKHETKAVYTNLPEGTYTFHVKGKNVFNEESKEAVYTFTILPPWYRTWWAYVLYVLFSAGFIWGVVTFFTRGLKRIILERTAEVVKQKEEIEYKNRDITDSINYAKRIQEAILPPKELMRSRFPESFILYRPKDIVAGDFYWFAEKDGRFIVAACDCTGHGVPGAFMSLIGYSLLNEVLLEKAFTHPGNALDSMRKGIIKSLGQTGQEGEQKDGMDMSLVSLEVMLDGKKMNVKLSYAGANNALYILRKGALIEINADKMPIGIYLGTEKPFTNNEMLLEAGDTIYLFSDGYADQFGGEKGKKFTKKRFKDLLISLQSVPMNKHKVILETTMDEWLGDQQQIDDVLVIGIRV